MGWAPPVARRRPATARADGAPVASLAGVPARDKGGHGAGCSCCSSGRRALRDEAGSASGPTAAPSTAPAPATSDPALPAMKRSITVFPVSVGTSTRDPAPDIRRAASIWRPCGVEIKAGIGQCWNSNVLDRKKPVDVLNQTKEATQPTSEEISLIQHQPGGGGALHAYYVPALSHGDRGEAFSKAFTPEQPEAVVVAQDCCKWDTLAHEIGHVLLATADHSSDPDNIMAGGDIRNIDVDKVTPAQCAKI